MATLLNIRATVEQTGGAALGDILSELEGYELTLDVLLPGSEEDGPNPEYTVAVLRLDRVSEVTQ